MYNNVVEAILDALWTHRFATLRFNFRGVGSSAGEYDGGAGEAIDAASALKFLIGCDGVRRNGAIMAGYSFGAMVAARAGAGVAEVGTILLVAPPLAMADLSFLAASGKRVVLASGDADPYCPAAGLAELAERLGGLCQGRHIIDGADHFFGGYESALSDAIRSSLTAL